MKRTRRIVLADLHESGNKLLTKKVEAFNIDTVDNLFQDFSIKVQEDVSNFKSKVLKELNSDNKQKKDVDKLLISLDKVLDKYLAKLDNVLFLAG